ncbi:MULTISPECIES: hypothetical protein [Rhodomicrobium]|uniref:hypothetical protein n=1 Tax=Rhodomicrobium TaxID=1068 RepID=UPI000B4A8E0E|nr:MULTISPECIES: hypothetical protein [Rhodomicrobium]
MFGETGNLLQPGAQAGAAAARWRAGIKKAAFMGRLFIAASIRFRIAFMGRCSGRFEETRARD